MPKTSKPKVWLSEEVARLMRERHGRTIRPPAITLYPPDGGLAANWSVNFVNAGGDPDVVGLNAELNEVLADLQQRYDAAT